MASICSVSSSAWLCLHDWWGWLFGSSDTAAGSLSWEVWWLRTGSKGLAILQSADLIVNMSGGKHVFLCCVFREVLTGGLSLLEFSSLFVHSDFLQFSLSTDLLNLLIINHFSCLSVFFIPMHLKLEDAGRVDPCSCKWLGQSLYSLSWHNQTTAHIIGQAFS